MEDYLIFIRHGEQPHTFYNWKITLNLSEGRRPQYFCKGKTTSILLLMEDTIGSFQKRKKPHYF